jgi:hypothetical protein
MSNKRPVFEANEDTFPFHQLRVGRRNDKECTTSEFGTVHQKTFLETSPNIYSEYEIQFPSAQSMSISYYVDAKGNNAKNPSLYLHPILYPKWSEKDALTGEVKKTKNPSGIKLESFCIKFVAAIVRELEKMSEDDRTWLMGDERAVMPNAADFMMAIAQFGKYDDKHKTKAKQPNYEKSPGFAVTVWSGDETKRNSGKDTKSGKDAKSGGAGERKKNDRALRIPNTNTIVFTTFYIAGPEEPIDANGKKKSKKQLKQEREEKKKPVSDYEKLKPFVYKPDGHANASDVNRTLIAATRTLCPSILWDPSKNLKGKLQFKAAEIKITGWQESSYNKELTDEALESTAAESKSVMEEFGFVHQVPKKRRRQSEESDDDDEEDDDENGGGGDMNVDHAGNNTNDDAIDGGSDNDSAAEAKRPQKKKVKLSNNNSSHIADGECDEEVFNEAYATGMDAYDGQ